MYSIIITLIFYVIGIWLLINEGNKNLTSRIIWNLL